MEIMKMIALLLGTALLFCACSRVSPHTLSYQNTSFHAGLAWESGGVSVRATLTSFAREPHSDVDTPRDLTLKFTAPDSLCGITVVRKDGNISATLDGVEVDTPGVAGLVSITSLFEIEASVTESKMAELDGAKLNYINAVSDEGEKYTLYLFSDSGLPRRICGSVSGEPCTLDVLFFDPIK